MKNPGILITEIELSLHNFIKTSALNKDRVNIKSLNLIIMQSI